MTPFRGTLTYKNYISGTNNKYIFTQTTSGRPDICTVQYSTVQYSTVQYSTVQYSTVQYSTVQYSTVQFNLYRILYCVLFNYITDH